MLLGSSSTLCPKVQLQLTGAVKRDLALEHSLRREVVIPEIKIFALQVSQLRSLLCLSSKSRIDFRADCLKEFDRERL